MSSHSICRWTFHAGAGGFVPAASIPEWGEDLLDTAGVVRLVAEKIRPRLPEHVELGMEFHYDYEVNEANAEEVAGEMAASGIHLALITPGAHRHFAYGGIASLDEAERKTAREFGRRTVDLAYGPLRRAWHPAAEMAPSLVLWNGSFGYDIATVGIREMYRNLRDGVAALCDHEAQQGGSLYVAIEPKPNEGHPAMLLPTVASAILLWKDLEDRYGTSLEKKGVNKEFGHSQMVGLDHVYDTVEEVEQRMLVHMHLNSQGYDNGITLGGPGKYDIDQGLRINGMNIAVAGLVRQAGFTRWKGHDIQRRPYDDAEQGLDRVVRSIISWEACAAAADELDESALMRLLEERRTAEAEDMMRAAAGRAGDHFDRWYGGA